jgi:NodT family efflux transporter outer membrane factor (OMF) lipoprotein
MRRLLLLGLLCLALPAAAASDDVLDDLPVPEAYTAGPSEPVSSTAWWREFGDPALEATIDRALAGNFDLEGLRAVQRQSEAAAMATFSPLVPTVSANAQATLAPIDSLGFGFIPPGAGGPEDPSAPKNYYNGTATLDAQWGLDVFGGNAASWSASRRDAQASRESLDDAARSTVAVVANAYFDVVLAYERVGLVEQQIQTNRELLEVVELRYERGDATALDVLQQKQSLASVEAQLPTVQLLAETTSQRLDVLLGRSPTTPTAPEAGLPELPERVAMGTPSDLIDHRPDLRAEAERLRSARSRRWSATTAALPTIGVSGKAGVQFIDTAEFQSQTFWNAGISASVPLFGGGRNVGGIRQANAAYDIQRATLSARLLDAIREVETALSQERLRRAAMDAQAAQLEAARNAANTARDQYLEGLTPFLNVQNAIASEQLAEQSLLQARRDVLSARIALYGALGGPWTRDLASSAGAQ